METQGICPSCRKSLPPDVPLGLCPECLIKSGFPTGTEPGSVEAAGGRFVPPPLEEVQALFPQLEILELIGRGGMGAVYRARQPALDRFVALKILPPAVAGDPGFAERFNREARALARLNHSNIVAVYDFGQVQGSAAVSAAHGPGERGTGLRPVLGKEDRSIAENTDQRSVPLYYFLMEFVDGSNLREIERAGRLSPAQALTIVPQICDALQFAHGESIVHRDIKPENILLDKKGRVKITDFGIAKIVGLEGSPAALTGAKDVLGTPHYMAPEQVEKPQTVDHRADIYSLGVVFYELLTGELPLGKFQPPSSKVQVDVRLDEVVLRSLAKEPERRYQQVSEVKTRVENIASTPPSRTELRESAPDPAAFQRQVNGPAIGLIVTGALNWMLFTLVFAYAAFRSPAGMFVWLPLIAMVLSGFIIYAGLKMMQLERRGAVLLASVLAMLVAPGNIIGLPIGIWALVVLGRRAVKDAMTEPQRRAGWPRPIGRKTQLAVCGAAMLILGGALRLMADKFNRPPDRLDAPVPIVGVGRGLTDQMRMAGFHWETTQVSLLPDDAGSTWSFVGLGRVSAGATNSVEPAYGSLRVTGTGGGDWRVQGQGDLSGMAFYLVGTGDPQTFTVQDTTGLSCVVERVIHREEADAQGLVFFDFETGTTLPPPFALAFRTNQAPAFVEVTAALDEWVRANRMDVLVRFEDYGWSRMNLRMQEDYVPEATQMDQSNADLVAAVFVRWDRVNANRPEVPAASVGNRYEDRFDRPKAFRTRSNTMGVMQWAGQSTTPHRVKVRFRFVETTNPGLGRTFAESSRPVLPPGDAGTMANPAPTPIHRILVVIQHELGRQLRDAGARYDTLEVTRVSGQYGAESFKATYRGLHGLRDDDGVEPDADGEFGVTYAGAGQWQGKLAGRRFAVQVASQDNVELPFVDDPQAVGEWETVDFVVNPADFNPEKLSPPRQILQLKGLTFLDGGGMRPDTLHWTKGVVMDEVDRTASRYEIRQINNRSYLFFEWKSGDVTITGARPHYYVLRKSDGQAGN